MHLTIQSEVKLDIHELKRDGLMSDALEAMAFVKEVSGNTFRKSRLLSEESEGGAFKSYPFIWAQRNGYNANIIKGYDFNRIRILYLVNDEKKEIHIIMFMNRNWDYESSQKVRNRIESCYDRLGLPKIH